MDTAPEVAGATEEAAICRICWECEDIEEGGALLAPCTCSGTQRHVHTRCLAQWIISQQDAAGVRRSGQGRLFTCSICGTAYRNIPADFLRNLTPELSWRTLPYHVLALWQDLNDGVYGPALQMAIVSAKLYVQSKGMVTAAMQAANVPQLLVDARDAPVATLASLAPAWFGAAMLLSAYNRQRRGMAGQLAVWVAAYANMCHIYGSAYFLHSLATEGAKLLAAAGKYSSLTSSIFVAYKAIATCAQASVLLLLGFGGGYCQGVLQGVLDCLNLPFRAVAFAAAQAGTARAAGLALLAQPVGNARMRLWGILK